MTSLKEELKMMELFTVGEVGCKAPTETSEIGDTNSV
ncbi:hypothetical protein HRED_05044, partial [Candidatus Haloredivivus sp. G17]